MTERLSSILKQSVCPIALLAALQAFPASAGPGGGQIVAGQAAIVQSGSRTVVNQTSDRAIINWIDFSLGQGETARFNQPSASAITLNRVTGANRSDIFGTISANGQVWIVNPNGIFFGPQAKVDVSGLLATTSDIADPDFMSGRFAFDGRSSASIENFGRITIRNAGLAAFVAPGVANDGVIAARLGSVTLASGHRFTVDLYGDQRINLAIDAKVTGVPVSHTGASVGSLVTNKGAIFADGGKVLMTATTAKGVVDRVMNIGGTIEARTASQQNGEIVLDGGDGGETRVSGTLDVSGRSANDAGGTVHIAGDQLALADGARIDASGAVGGGEVLVGGDAHGGRPVATGTILSRETRGRAFSAPAASRVAIAPTATIRADATARGDGGKVVVWSDGTTDFHGTISARGGKQGGAGGFVETSGFLSLNFEGARVDTTAFGGRSGTWLLDPSDQIINQAAANTIAANLLNNDVTIDTSGSGGSGDITLASGVVLATTNVANRTLTFSAFRNIIVGAGARIDASGAAGALNVVLNANNTANGIGSVRIGQQGNIATAILTHGGNLIIGGGVCTLTGCTDYATSSIAQGVVISDTTIATGGGLFSSRGRATAGPFSGHEIRGGSLITTGGNIAIEGLETANDFGASFWATSTDAVINAGTGAISVSGSGGFNDIRLGNVHFTANGGVTLSLGTTHGLSLNAAYDFTGTGAFVIRPDSTTKTFGIGTTSTNAALPTAGLAVLSHIAGFSDVQLGRADSTALTTVSGSLSVAASRLHILGSGVTFSAGAAVADPLAGSTIVVAAGNGALSNNAGASVLSPGSGGRWLVYSANPSANTFGGLNSNNTAIWHQTYSGLPPASVSQSGNRYIFAFQPTVIFSSTNLSKTYGQAISASLASAYSVSGIQGGVANAFLADSAASAYSGAPSISSAGAAAAATVGGGPYPVVIAAGTVAGLNGYAVAFNSAGTLSVAAKTVTASLTGTVTKIYDGTVLATLSRLNYVLSGVINGDVVALNNPLFGSYDNAKLGTGKTVSVTGLALIGSASGNYILAASAVAAPIGAITTPPAANQAATYINQLPVIVPNNTPPKTPAPSPVIVIKPATPPSVPPAPPQQQMPLLPSAPTSPGTPPPGQSPSTLPPTGAGGSSPTPKPIALTPPPGKPSAPPPDQIMSVLAPSPAPSPGANSGKPSTPASSIPPQSGPSSPSSPAPVTPKPTPPSPPLTKPVASSPPRVDDDGDEGGLVFDGGRPSDSSPTHNAPPVAETGPSTPPPPPPSPALALSPAEVAKLPLAEIEALLDKLTPEQMAAVAPLLPPDVLRKSVRADQVIKLDVRLLSPAQLHVLTNDQLIKIPGNHWGELSDEMLLNLSSTDILYTYIPRDRYNLLVRFKPANINGYAQLITNAILPRISPDAVAVLKPDAIAAFSPDTVSGFTPDQIRRLSDAQFKALSPLQVAHLSPEAFKALTPAQIASLDPSYIKYMDQQHINDMLIAGALPASVVAGITKQQWYDTPSSVLRALSPDTVASMTMQQINGMDEFGFSLIAGKLSAQQIAALPDDKLQRVDFASLSPEAQQAYANRVAALASTYGRNVPRPVSGGTAFMDKLISPDVLKLMNVDQLDTIYRKGACADTCGMVDEARAAAQLLQLTLGSPELLAKIQPNDANFLHLIQHPDVLARVVDKLNPQTVAAIDGGVLNRIIDKLTPQDLWALMPGKLAKLDTRKLTIDQVSNLTPAQVNEIYREKGIDGLSMEQWLHVSDQAVSQLPPDPALLNVLIPRMSPEALKKLTADQVKAAFGKMSVKAIQALSPAQLGVIGKYMSFAQVLALTSSQAASVPGDIGKAINAARNPPGLQDPNAPVAGLSFEREYTPDGRPIDDAMSVAGDVKDWVEAVGLEGGKVGNALDAYKSVTGAIDAAKATPLAMQIRDALYAAQLEQYNQALARGDKGLSKPMRIDDFMLSLKVSKDPKEAINSMLQQVRQVKLETNKAILDKAKADWLKQAK